MMQDVNGKMDALKKKACEALEEYIKKDSWKPDDLVGAKDAVKLYNEACDAQMKQGIWENMEGDWGNSGYSPHGYARMSYGNGMNSYGNGMNGTSQMRGRDANTGQYMSRGPMYDNSQGYSGGPYNPMPMLMGYDKGYSTHSIKDRMIAALEYQMDNAGSEYEREEVRKAIAEIEKMKR